MLMSVIGRVLKRFTPTLLDHHTNTLPVIVMSCPVEQTLKLGKQNERISVYLQVPSTMGSE
jgi:hypothetical protein